MNASLQACESTPPVILGEIKPLEYLYVLNFLIYFFRVRHVREIERKSKEMRKNSTVHQKYNETKDTNLAIDFQKLPFQPCYLNNDFNAPAIPLCISRKHLTQKLSF